MICTGPGCQRRDVRPVDIGNLGTFRCPEHTPGWRFPDCVDWWSLAVAVGCTVGAVALLLWLVGPPRG